MRLVYSGFSKPSATAIAEVASDIQIARSNSGEINWGRAVAQTRLNPDITNTTNKHRMRELFKQHNVPMPYLMDNAAEALTAVFNGTTIIGRPDRHSQGRGLWKITNQYEFFQAVHGTHRKQAATHFMEFIDAPREYRVHVFNGKSIRISEKLFGTTGATAHGAYTTGRPRHNVNHVRAAAKQAVEAVGLDFGAVDVLADDDHCWVLEVNAAPGLGGSMPQLYAETFRKYFEGA